MKMAGLLFAALVIAGVPCVASAFSELYIKVDGSNADFVRVHELSSQVAQDFRRTPSWSVLD
jgi:hypothetical protein